MQREILSASDLAHIETRFISGAFSKEDIQLLIATCRHFLSATNGGSSPTPGSA